jgi:hypothetical protein
MSCHEVVFARAHCHVDVEPNDGDPAWPAFVAVMTAVDDDGIGHPIVNGDGSRAQVSGDTEDAALNSAIVFLAAHFGALAEYDHTCVETRPVRDGAPVIVAGGETRP